MEKPDSKIDQTPDNQPTYWHRVKHGPSGLLIVALVIVVFIFGLIFASFTLQRRAEFGFSGHSISIHGFGPIGGRIGFSMSEPQNVGNQDSIEGVVTNVSGNTLTVAGDGTTNTVQTNSSTKYTGGSSAVVNDTVVVLGNTSNSTLTANLIEINPSN